jgi:hypothetical protein
LNEPVAVVVEPRERAILLNDNGIDGADAAGKVVNPVEQRHHRLLVRRRYVASPATKNRQSRQRKRQFFGGYR